MRRLYRVLLGGGLSLVLATAAQAQVAVGIRGGYNNSTLSVEEDGVSAEDFSSRSGFHGGVDLAFRKARNPASTEPLTSRSK